jgi:hypothetical protein
MLLEDSLLYLVNKLQKIRETYHERKLAYPQPILLCRQQTSQSKRNLSVIIKIFLSGMGGKAMNNWMKEILHTPLTVLLLPSEKFLNNIFLSRNGWKTMNNNLDEENLPTPDSFIIAVNKLLKSREKLIMNENLPLTVLLLPSTNFSKVEKLIMNIFLSKGIWKAMNNNLNEKLAYSMTVLLLPSTNFSKSETFMNENLHTPDSFIIASTNFSKVKLTSSIYISVQMGGIMNNNLDE